MCFCHSTSSEIGGFFMAIREVYAPILDIQNYFQPINSHVDQNRKDMVLLAREKEIVNNLLHYVAEFRLGVKFDEFYYREEVNSFTGERYLASTQPGPVRDVFRKAIDERLKQGKSAHREIAEGEIGFIKLENALLDAPKGTMFIWTSPPGPKEDGYGAYSFTFVGQVEEDSETQQRKIRVIPYRNIFSLEEHRANLSQFTSGTEMLQTPEDFLAHPVIILQRPGIIDTPEDIIRMIGEQEKINMTWFTRLSTILEPFTDHYVSLVKKRATLDELREARDSIEKVTIFHRDEILYALQQEKNAKPLFEFDRSIDEVFRGLQEIPLEAVGGGSCPPREDTVGSTNENFDALTLSEYHNTYNSEEGFLCPNCKKSAVKGNKCFMCSITKQDWQQKTGIKCA